MPDPRVVVVLPAYNAGKTLERTVAEIPPGHVDALLLVDDASQDDTVSVAQTLGIPTVVHPVNRGYGGNQKTCYRTALEMGADIVVMLHPDYQYDPRLIPDMVARLRTGSCDVVLGSRMVDGKAREGGMPWWKRLGNRVLTTLQNLLLGTSLSEFHTGYRAFTRDALIRSGFEGFVDGFVFDAQMLVSLISQGARIEEIPCPARYLPEASSIAFWGSVRYGLGCLSAAFRFRLHRMGLATAGWMPDTERERHAASMPTLLFGVLAVGFLLWRSMNGIDWMQPLRNADSATYNFAPYDLVSFTGGAPRPWPIPFLYSLYQADEDRALVQLVLSSFAWLVLASGVSVAIRDRRIAVPAVVAVLALGLTSQAQSWDRLIMPESVGLSGAVAVVGLVLWSRSRPSRGVWLALGAVGGVLALARPSLAPFLLLFGAWEIGKGASGRVMKKVGAGVLICAGVAWLFAVLPRQDEAYRVFERDVRNFESAPYASDTYASVLFERIIGDPSAMAWLEEQGAPPLLEGMDPPRFLEDKWRWWSFRGAYGPDDRWQAWFEEQGGLSLPFRLFFAEPMAHLSALVRDLPLMLEAPWAGPTFPEYGPAAPEPMVSAPFFVSVAGVPLDVVVLFLGVGALTVLAHRRDARRVPLEWIGIGVSAVSVGVILGGWFLVGIELVRHTVPGALGLRLGLILWAAALADEVVARGPIAEVSDA